VLRGYSPLLNARQVPAKSRLMQSHRWLPTEHPNGSRLATSYSLLIQSWHRAIAAYQGIGASGGPVSLTQVAQYQWWMRTLSDCDAIRTGRNWGGAHGSRKASIARAFAQGNQVMNCAVDTWDMTVARPGDRTINKRVDEHGFTLIGASIPRWEGRQVCQSYGYSTGRRLGH
jgi:hypothetical protein